MTDASNRTTAKRLPREQKAAQTDRVAKAYIEAERQARQKRTDRLRALRLEREAADAETSLATAQEKKKAPLRSPKRRT